MSGKTYKRVEEFEEHVRRMVVTCLSSSKDPYTSGQMYTYLYNFMHKACNQMFRPSIWAWVEGWITDEQEKFYLKMLDMGPQSNTSALSELLKSNPKINDEPSTSKTFKEEVVPFTITRREEEFKRLKDCFRVFSNELKIRRGDVINIDEVLRFRECLSVLPECDFEPLLSVLWTSFFTKDQDEPTTKDFKPKVASIADFDDYVSANQKTCFVCSEDVTYTKLSFRQHLVEFHSIHWFHCSFCVYYTYAKRSIHHHCLTSHYICQHCRKKFPNFKQVNAHIDADHSSRKNKEARKENDNHDQSSSKKHRSEHERIQSTSKKNPSQRNRRYRRRQASPSPESKAKAAPDVIENMRQIIRTNRIPGEVDIKYRVNKKTGTCVPEVSLVEPAFSMVSVGTQTESNADEMIPESTSGQTTKPTHDTTPSLAENFLEQHLPPITSEQYSFTTPPPSVGGDNFTGTMEGELDFEWITESVEIEMDPTLAELNGCASLIEQSELDNLHD